MNQPYSELVSLTLTRRTKRWVFPQDRFVDYGPEDEWWARKVGFGSEREVEETVMFPRCYCVGVDPDGRMPYKAIGGNGVIQL